MDNTSRRRICEDLLNNLLSNVAVVTYTTSKYADLWPVHFGQLTRHLGGIKSYVFSDKGSGEKFDFKEHELIEHDDSAPYYTQWLDGLKSVKEEYIIYLQDDFFLHTDVDHGKITHARELLETSSYDFVRLLRCGYQTPLDRHVRDGYFEVHQDTNDIFSQQATLWKKDRFAQLYDHVKSVKWLEGEHWNVGCREIDITGVFVWRGENQIGKFHFDSVVWPAVSTAINRGQWNMDEMPEVMNRLVKEYNIDTSIRGVRRR